MGTVGIQIMIYITILVMLAILLGKYIGKVMKGEPVFLTRAIDPVERKIYKLLRLNKEDEEMSWKTYAFCAIFFCLIGFAVVFLLQLFQEFLPLNPERVSGTSWHLAFNTAASFVTNTNWQSYGGESTLSYLTQMLGLNVQNFVSAAMGIAVLFALIRGFVKVKEKGIGNFYKDMVKIVLYILVPISLVISIVLVSQGVPQNFKAYEEVKLAEPISVEHEDGTVTLVENQVVPMGPAASQIAIKQLGTNGGGFYKANSAHPLENPTILTNLIEMIAILLLPSALCFTFGRNIKDKRQGKAIFAAMLLMLMVSLGVIGYNEYRGTPQLAQNGQVAMQRDVENASGNMEGKETRFGIAASSVWAGFTTAAANGSVNSMHDSLTPIGGMIPMLLMMLGEVVFGGAGSGLYTMLGFAMLTVFIAGLMVGRTPEYLGKKVEPFEMKMAILICMATPTAILIGSGIAALLPATIDSLGNGGAHGLSEVLYAYSSAGGNNGSAFSGLQTNTVFYNLSLGCIMLFVRFLPMLSVLAIAGSMAGKKKMAEGPGTLPTHDRMFVGLLIFVIILVSALSFFPAMALGPIAEFLQM